MPARKRKSQAAPADTAPRRSKRSKKNDPTPEPEPEPEVLVEAEAGPSAVVNTDEAFEATTAEPEAVMPAAIEDLVRDEEERDSFAAMAPLNEAVQEVEAVVSESGLVVVESVEEIVEKQLVEGPEADNEVEVRPAAMLPGDVALAIEEGRKHDMPAEISAMEAAEAEDEEALDHMDVDASGAETPAAAGDSTNVPPLTMEERMDKLKELRSKMRDSFQANRKDLVAEHTKIKTSARELARLEKKRKLAEVLREKADAEERGEDPERRKNWEWSIEENEEWEKKQARKKKRADFSFNNDEDHARRRYKKDLDFLKPDLEAYNRQKEVALGLAPGTLIAGSSSSALVKTSSGPMTVAQRAAAEDLYRDANSLIYADNKPTDDAIDRVVSKLNLDIDRRAKFSRKRTNEEEGDITYINERNRVFNKKIARYYDKYTAEIRASFERGTAL